MFLVSCFLLPVAVPAFGSISGLFLFMLLDMVLMKSGVLHIHMCVGGCSGYCR
jgi:hypothetical protein